MADRITFVFAENEKQQNFGESCNLSGQNAKIKIQLCLYAN